MGAHFVAKKGGFYRPFYWQFPWIMMCLYFKKSLSLCGVGFGPRVTVKATENF